GGRADASMAPAGGARSSTRGPRRCSGRARFVRRGRPPPSSCSRGGTPPRGSHPSLWPVATLTFLGTGNYLAPGRYWNSFVLDGNVLVEPCPTALPHLRKVGIPATEIDVIVISHFHADHTFGWPFLLLEMLRRDPNRPLWIVGPPGVEQFLADMMK